MFKPTLLLTFTLLVLIILFSCKVKEKIHSPTTPVDETSSLFIKMEKTPCYGKCPSYVVEIFTNGDVNFIGKKFIDFEGKYFSKISIEQLNQLKTKINDINFFELNNKYDSPATDIPACITEIHLDNNIKKITNRHQGPPTLKELEQLIEEIVLKSNLQKVIQ